MTLKVSFDMDPPSTRAPGEKVVTGEGEYTDLAVALSLVHTHTHAHTHTRTHTHLSINLKF